MKIPQNKGLLPSTWGVVLFLHSTHLTVISQLKDTKPNDNDDDQDEDSGRTKTTSIPPTDRPTAVIRKDSVATESLDVPRPAAPVSCSRYVSGASFVIDRHRHHHRT